MLAVAAATEAASRFLGLTCDRGVLDLAELAGDRSLKMSSKIKNI